MTKAFSYRESILTVCLLLFGSSCFVLNETGLNFGHIKGSEAADKILSAAIVTEAALAATTLGVVYISPSTFFTSVIAGIQLEEYYKEREVDACVADIHNLKMPEVALGFDYLAFSCKLEPDNILLDP